MRHFLLLLLLGHRVRQRHQQGGQPVGQRNTPSDGDEEVPRQLRRMVMMNKRAEGKKRTTEVASWGYKQSGVEFS